MLLSDITRTELVTDIYKVMQGSEFYLPVTGEAGRVKVNRHMRCIKLNDEAAHLYMGHDDLPCLLMLRENMHVVVEEDKVWKK